MMELQSAVREMVSQNAVGEKVSKSDSEHTRDGQDRKPNKANKNICQICQKGLLMNKIVVLRMEVDVNVLNKGYLKKKFIEYSAVLSDWFPAIAV